MSSRGKRMVELALGKKEKSTKEKTDIVENPHKEKCGIKTCDNEIYEACVSCFVFLCWDHRDSECHEHNSALFEEELIDDDSDKDPDYLPDDTHEIQLDDESDNEHTLIDDLSNPTEPERKKSKPQDFVVDGTGPENDRQSKQNNSKSNKVLRNSGMPYWSGNKFHEGRRKLGPRCGCKEIATRCSEISDKQREAILEEYYDIADLNKQRQFLADSIDTVDVKSRKVLSHVSRRNSTRKYFLKSESGDKICVCKEMFLKTLGIAERQVRTAIEKRSISGIVEVDKRGKNGRMTKDNEKIKMEQCIEHVKLFPAVESHYCRASTSNVYVSSELSYRKMFDMYREYCVANSQTPASFSTYVKAVVSQKIKFHAPKKDMCELCDVYHKSFNEEKENLFDEFDAHIKNKKEFRRLKEEAKSSVDQSVCTATFDLMQTFQLPKSNLNAIYYKTRLTCYLFTVYELSTKKVECFFWHEGEGKRGSCEISTCLYLWLKRQSDNGVKKVLLFADGCFGQNRNSIMPSMFMHVLKTTKIEEISLFFSEKNHGQNEGDSAHSCISEALSRCSVINTPSEVVPIIRNAKVKEPFYSTTVIKYSDIVDFKSMSKELGILNNRVSTDGCSINWTKIHSLKVVDCFSLDYKIRHTDFSWKHIQLKEKRSWPVLKALYNERPCIPLSTYNSILSLSGSVLRNEDDIKFYKSLSHN